MGRLIAWRTRLSLRSCQKAGECLITSLIRIMYPVLPGTVPMSVCLNVHITETVDVKRIYPHKKKKTPWSESASELYRPTDRRLSAKLVLTFEDRRCHVVSVTDPCGRILIFLDWRFIHSSTILDLPYFVGSNVHFLFSVQYLLLHS
jgi:hypothetical protein